jgi:NAD(P)-dependent dehydrogenase (short-subunit alcohol dehydrogenase family)
MIERRCEIVKKLALIIKRDIPLEEFEYTINVNLRASFVLVKGVIEGMKAQKWGRIIFMSSIAAQGGGINGCRSSSHTLSPLWLFFPFTI